MVSGVRCQNSDDRVHIIEYRGQKTEISRYGAVGSQFSDFKKASVFLSGYRNFEASNNQGMPLP